MEIRTARLLLRRARSDDLAAMHAVMSSPAAMRYWSTLPHASLEVTAAWFPKSLMDFDNPDQDEFVIVHDGRVIGYVGIWKSPEFGFILHPDAWGQGFATEAAGAFVTHAFSAHDIAALTADVDPRNAGSLAVLGKLGFRKSGEAKNTFLLGDEWCDSIYLRLERPA